MDIKNTIKSIASDIKYGRFTSEASVSQGIVLRLLSVLGWDIFDAEIVIPEYSIFGKRVDFALCHPRNKPMVLIEVKQVGNAEGFEKQLFEYAFHQGIPFAILTDGQEWHFFLPGEQGLYQERRVYKLDILERDLDESYNRFTRYLDHERVASGLAIDSARDDYRNVSKQREIKDTLPIAWRKLIDEKEELLLELLADKVESLCGYKPEFELVENFLENLSYPIVEQPVINIDKRIIRKKRLKDKVVFDQNKNKQPGFTYKMKNFNARNARDVMINIFKIFAKEDNTFLERFTLLPEHGKKRRFLAKNKYDLYPDRTDLAEQSSHAVEFLPGWWLGLNYNKTSIEKIIRMACEVRGVKYGSELTISL